MKSAIRGAAMAGMATLLGTGTLWAHPGHVSEGGLWHSLTHALSSPYHVAIICAVVVLAVAATLAARPGRAARQDEREANELL